MKRPTAIDLFSGCGGLSTGLRSAGFDILAAVESDPSACSTYRKNHSSVVLLDRDIRKVRPSYLLLRLGLKKGDLDLLAGCPPCQGFSTLRTLNGAYEIDEPLNDLIFQFLKFTKAFRPRSIMMENVPGLADDPRLAAFEAQISRLGYSSAVKILDAAEFGAPQRRRRMVLIATSGVAPKFPRRSPAKKTVRSALAHLCDPKHSADPLHNYEVTRARHVEEIIRLVPKDGGSRSDLPPKKRLRCHTGFNGFGDVYGRMEWDRPSPTITGGCINPSKGRFLHPVANRAITLREAALLQSFPRSYQFDMSPGRYAVAQMIGNAFPPKLAELLGRTVLRVLSTSN